MGVDGMVIVVGIFLISSRCPACTRSEEFTAAASAPAPESRGGGRRTLFIVVMFDLEE
jgi:hypothetical protein